MGAGGDLKVPEEIASVFEDTPDKVRCELRLEKVPQEERVSYTNSRGAFVGEICWCPTYDEHVYYSRRDDRKSHFYYNKQGYAIDDDIIKDLQERNVSRLIFERIEQESVVEFDVEQYLEGEHAEVIDHDYGVQHVTPVLNAHTVRPDAAGKLFPS